MRIINNTLLLIIIIFQKFNKTFKSFLIFFTPYNDDAGIGLVPGVGHRVHNQAFPVVVIKFFKADMNPFIGNNCQLQAVDIFIIPGLLKDVLLLGNQFKQPQLGAGKKFLKRQSMVSPLKSSMTTSSFCARGFFLDMT